MALEDEGGLRPPLEVLDGLRGKLIIGSKESSQPWFPVTMPAVISRVTRRKKT